MIRFTTIKFYISGYWLLSIFSIISESVTAQSSMELNQGWKCRNVREVKANGVEISGTGFNTDDWMPATIPGTVLTTLLDNEKIPDPFYGLNNEMIPDI